MSKKLSRKQTVKLPRAIQRKFPNVMVVTDATKPVSVSVNKKDCKIATKRNPSECALAIAAKRELKVDGVIIGIGTTYLIKNNKAIRFGTPESVRREIVSFDRHQDFNPGEYYLVPKPPSNRLGKYVRRTLHAGGENKTAKRKYHYSARVRML